MIRFILLFSCCIGLYTTACKKMVCGEGPMDRLTAIFKDDTFQLTGVAISPQGRVFTNYSLGSSIYKNEIIDADGRVSAQAIYADEKNYLWVVDPASPKEGFYQNSHKLVKIDVATNTIERTYYFEGVAGAISYISDVRVDNKLQVAYLTNSGEGGIIIVNLATGKAKQVLQDHYSTKSDPEYNLIIDGHELMKNGVPVKIHSDGIALTPNGDWLYYKPLTDDKLYRIRTEHLRNDTMSSTTLGEKVEDLGHFFPTDGMIFDANGNLYLGDVRSNSIKRISPDLKVLNLITDERLIWPGSYSITEDGYLYISCSQMHKQPEYNNGVNKRTTPYVIYKLKVL